MLVENKFTVLCINLLQLHMSNTRMLFRSLKSKMPRLDCRRISSIASDSFSVEAIHPSPQLIHKAVNYI